MSKRENKLTNKYIFRIERIQTRPATWEDNHGLNYMSNGQKEVEIVEETINIGRFEIKDDKVIDIISALLR